MNAVAGLRGQRFSASTSSADGPDPVVIVKAKDFLERNQSNNWTEKEVSQANFLILSLLQESTLPSSSAHDEHNAIKQAGRILHRWIQESIASRVSSTGLLDILHRVVNTMKDSSSSSSVTEALRLLDQMEFLSDESQKPDRKAFTMVLNMLAASSNDADAEVAKQLFQRSLERGGREDVMVWNSYLHVLSKCSLVDRAASSKAEDVLKKMISSNLTNSNSFSIVLHALANSGRPDRAQLLLGRMLDMKELEVTEFMFNTCIDAYAKQGNGERSEALLQTMLSYEHLTPDVVTFSSAINAWAKSQHPDAAERAEDLLMRMENMNCSPTTECFTAAIDAWSRSKKPWATKRARGLLQSMETQCLNGNQQVCPSITTYASVIHGLANSSNPKAAIDAEHLLEQMKQIARSGRRDFALNTIAFSTVIDVLAKSRAPDAHQRALALLRDMQERAKAEGSHVAPNSVTFNSVISAFARRGEVEFARMLLDEMIEISSVHGNEQVAPDTISYSAVLNAYSKWFDPQAPERALELLAIMESEYNRGNHRVKPNAFAFTCTIASLAHSLSPDAPGQAEALFKRMQDASEKGDTGMKPSSYTLGALLQVWVASKEAQAPERASSLIQWGEKEFKAGDRDLKPNRICYNHLIATWASSDRAGALDRVREILLGMSKSDDVDMKPDVHSYVRLMSTIQQARLKDAPKQQLRVVKGLFDAYQKGDKSLKPNSRALNLVLISCKSVRGTKASVEACGVLEEVGRLIISMQDWAPNPTTYKMFFNESRRLTFDNRALIEDVYDACNTTRKCTRDVEVAYSALKTQLR